MKMKRSEKKERKYQRLVEQESLILEATEMISGLIEEGGENRKGLAEKLGRTKGFVTQILSGDRNMTLRTLADFAFALDHRVKMKPVPLVEHGDGGEAAGGEGRTVARVVPGTGALSERSGHEQADDPRRPVAAEGAALYPYGSFADVTSFIATAREEDLQMGFEAMPASPPAEVETVAG